VRQSRTSAYLWFLTLSDFRRRTPGPPPFSSMNSTPAVSMAWRMAMSLGTVIDVSLSESSARLIVATPTPDAPAKSSARQRRSALAARIWWLVKFCRFMLTSVISNDMHNIIRYWMDRRIADPSNVNSDEGGSCEIGRVQKSRLSTLFHWRLGRADHHGRR